MVTACHYKTNCIQWVTEDQSVWWGWEGRGYLSASISCFAPCEWRRMWNEYMWEWSCRVCRILPSLTAPWLWYVLLQHAGAFSVIYCQMLPWSTKHWPDSINTKDIVTNTMVLCTVYQKPKCESNFTLTVWILLKLRYLNMLFMLEIGSSAGHHKNRLKLQINQLGRNWCLQSESRLIWWHLVYCTQYCHVCNSISDIDEMRLILKPW